MKVLLMLSIMLTVPLLAARTPKLPSAKIRVAVGKAIKAGDANVLANVLDEHGLHVDSVLLSGGYTVLHEAVVDGSPEIVEYLIRNDAQVNVANEYGQTPLDEATLFAKEEIVILLEQAGATHGERFIRAAPTAHGIRGEQTDEQTDEHTALVSAPSVEQSPSLQNSYGITEFRSMPMLTEPRSNDVLSELVYAAWKGDTETVALLLDRGANLEAQDRDGRTAFMFAAWGGQTETAALLLDRGANIEAQDQGSLTAPFAIRSGSTVWMFVTLGGLTALMLAARGWHTETVALLLDHDADIEAKDNKEWTALMHAAWGGHTETVALLLDRGADIEAENISGHTALVQAVLGGHTETAALLLDRGANIEVQDSDGNTPLMWAGRHTETVALLLDRGANIEAQDRNGNTALMLAADHEHTETAALLRERAEEID